VRKNTSEFAETMTAAAQEAGARVAFMLRAIYRDCPEKEVARSLNVDPRTVRDWLAGKTPNGTHLVALCQRYGRAFSDFVLAGPSWVDEARLEAEIAALRVRADLLEMEIQNERQGGRKQCGTGSRGR
jgi:transcriptional regulator with XRE-family HTH domain